MPRSRASCRFPAPPCNASSRRCDLRSAPRVDLLPDERDRLLIDRRSVPGLDRGKVRLAGLIPRPRLPAVSLEEVGGRGERARWRVEIADAKIQDVLRQELRLPDLSMHRAALIGRDRTLVKKLQGRVELVGEIVAAAAI